MITETRTRTVAYLRVSTAFQAEEGVSLDAQRRKAELYAELHDLELVDVVVDAGESAKTLDRPGLQRVLEMLRRGDAKAVLVVKIDRLTRSIGDLAHLVETYFGDKARYAAELLSVGDQVDTRTAAGRLVLNVLMSVAQWEREAIGERTSVAMRHMRSEGRYTGGKAPFGYQLDDAGQLITNVEEQAAIHTARRLRNDGLSLRAISDKLAEMGHLARSGKPFSASAVNGLLREAA